MITTDDLYQRWFDELARVDKAPNPVVLASLEMVASHFGMDMCGELANQQLLAEDSEIKILEASRIAEGSRVEFHLVGEEYEGIAQDWMRNPLDRNDPLIQVDVHGTTTILPQSELQVVGNTGGDSFVRGGDMLPDVFVVVEKSGLMSSGFHGVGQRKRVLEHWEFELAGKAKNLAEFEFAEPITAAARARDQHLVEARRVQLLELHRDLLASQVIKRFLEDGLLADSGVLTPLVAARRPNLDMPDLPNLGVDWDPSDHPRGRDGMFIDAGGWVTWPGARGRKHRGRVVETKKSKVGGGWDIRVQPLDDWGRPKGHVEKHRNGDLTRSEPPKADLKEIFAQYAQPPGEARVPRFDRTEDELRREYGADQARQAADDAEFPDMDKVRREWDERQGGPPPGGPIEVVRPKPSGKNMRARLRDQEEKGRGEPDIGEWERRIAEREAEEGGEKEEVRLTQEDILQAEDRGEDIPISAQEFSEDEEFARRGEREEARVTLTPTQQETWDRAIDAQDADPFPEHSPHSDAYQGYLENVRELDSLEHYENMDVAAMVEAATDHAESELGPFEEADAEDVEGRLSQAGSHNPFPRNSPQWNAYEGYIENASEPDSLEHYEGMSVDELVEAATDHAESEVGPGELTEASWGQKFGEERRTPGSDPTAGGRFSTAPARWEKQYNDVVAEMQALEDSGVTSGPEFQELRMKLARQADDEIAWWKSKYIDEDADPEGAMAQSRERLDALRGRVMAAQERRKAGKKRSPTLEQDVRRSQGMYEIEARHLKQMQERDAKRKENEEKFGPQPRPEAVPDTGVDLDGEIAQLDEQLDGLVAELNQYEDELNAIRDSGGMPTHEQSMELADKRKRLDELGTRRKELTEQKRRETPPMFGPEGEPNEPERTQPAEALPPRNQYEPMTDDEWRAARLDPDEDLEAAIAQAREQALGLQKQAVESADAVVEGNGGPEAVAQASRDTDRFAKADRYVAELEGRRGLEDDMEPAIPAGMADRSKSTPELAEALELGPDATHEQIIQAFIEKAKSGDTGAISQMHDRLVGSRWEDLDDRRVQNLDLNQGDGAWDGELVRGRNKILGYVVPRGGGLGDGELETFDDEAKARDWLEGRLADYRMPWLAGVQQNPELFDEAGWDEYRPPGAPPAPGEAEAPGEVPEVPGEPELSPEDEELVGQFERSVDFWDKVGPDLAKWEDWGPGLQVVTNDDGEPYLRLPEGDGWNQTFLDRYVDPNGFDIAYRVTNGFTPGENGMNRPKWEDRSTRWHSKPLDALRDMRARSGQSTAIPGANWDSPFSLFGDDQVVDEPDLPATPDVDLPDIPEVSPQPGRPGPAAPEPDQPTPPEPPFFLDELGIDRGDAADIPVVDGGHDAFGNRKIVPDGQPDQFTNTPASVAILPDGRFQVYDRDGNPSVGGQTDGVHDNYADAIKEARNLGWGGYGGWDSRSPEDLDRARQLRNQVADLVDAQPSGGANGQWRLYAGGRGNRVLSDEAASRVVYTPPIIRGANGLYTGSVHRDPESGKWIGSWTTKGGRQQSKRSVKEFDDPTEAMSYVKTGVDDQVEKDRQRAKARGRTVEPPLVPRPAGAPSPTDEPVALEEGEVGVRTAPPPVYEPNGALRYGMVWDEGAMDVVKSPRHSFVRIDETMLDENMVETMQYLEEAVPTEDWFQMVIGDTADRWDNAGVRMPGIVTNLPLTDSMDAEGGNYMRYPKWAIRESPSGGLPLALGNISIVSKEKPVGSFSNRPLGNRVATTSHEMAHVLDMALEYKMRRQQGQGADGGWVMSDGLGGILGGNKDFMKAYADAANRMDVSTARWISGMKAAVNDHIDEPLAKELFLAWLDSDAPEMLRNHSDVYSMGYFIRPTEVFARIMPSFLERRLRRRGHTQQADELRDTLLGEYDPGISDGEYVTYYNIGATLPYRDRDGKTDRVLDAFEALLDGNGLLDDTDTGLALGEPGEVAPAAVV